MYFPQLMYLLIYYGTKLYCEDTELSYVRSQNDFAHHFHRRRHPIITCITNIIITIVRIRIIIIIVINIL